MLTILKALFTNSSSVGCGCGPNCRCGDNCRCKTQGACSEGCKCAS